MKTLITQNYRTSLFTIAAIASCFAAQSISHAADVTWDISPGTVGAGDSAITGGAGTWDTTIGNWTTDAGANNVAWVNGNNDTALFGGTAGTVTLGEDITAAALKFSTGGYIIEGAGNTITLGANGTQLSPSLSPSGTTTINANIDTNGNDFTASGSGSFILGGVISGSGNVIAYNGSNLTLTGANTYTGKTTITCRNRSGLTLSVSSFNSVSSPPQMPSSSLGVPADAAAGTILIGVGDRQAGFKLLYTGSGEITDRVLNFQFNSNASHTLEASGSGLIKFTEALTTGNLNNRNGSLILSGTGSGEIAAPLPPLPAAGLRKQGSGTWILSGTSSIDEGVAVQDGTLTIDGSINPGSTLTVSGGTLDGSGTLGFDIDGATADQVTVTGGTLNISGLAVEIVPGGGSGLTEAEYILVDATGVGYTGNFTGFAGTAPTGYSLDYGTADQVKLVSTGGPTDPFDSWATSGTLGAVTFDGDTNSDGVQDGLAFLLGVANPDDDANGLLPTVTESAGDLVLTFNVLNAANRGTATIDVEHSTDLGVSDAWLGATLAVDANDVSFSVVSGDPTDAVTATIDSAAAEGGDELFGRVNASE